MFYGVAKRDAVPIELQGFAGSLQSLGPGSPSVLSTQSSFPNAELGRARIPTVASSRATTLHRP